MILTINGSKKLMNNININIIGQKSNNVVIALMNNVNWYYFEMQSFLHQVMKISVGIQFLTTSYLF